MFRLRPVRPFADPPLPRLRLGQGEESGPPARCHRTHGIRYFHGCCSIGDDQLWGVTRRRKGGDHSLAALKSIRAARPDYAPIYVIMDNLSASKTSAIRTWADKNKGLSFPWNRTGGRVWGTPRFPRSDVNLPAQTSVVIRLGGTVTEFGGLGLGCSAVL